MTSSASPSEDLLALQGRWSEEHQRNVYAVRGFGPSYDRLYAWLNGARSTARSVVTDFPWDYIVFDDPFYERQFLTIYEGQVDLAADHRPPPVGVKPLGWVPHAERVVGQRYLEVCGHHEWRGEPPPAADVGDLIQAALMTEITKELDEAVLNDLLAQLTNEPESNHDRA